MAYAFIGTVVHVDEQGFPVCPERFRIHSITVILARDETTGRAHHPHRLIVAAVSVLQFINPGTGRFAQKLVAIQMPCRGAPKEKQGTYGCSPPQPRTYLGRRDRWPRKGRQTPTY